MARAFQSAGNVIKGTGNATLIDARSDATMEVEPELIRSRSRIA